MSTPTNPIGVELVIRAAQLHGQNSEPDHEVGDLQDALRLMWSKLTPEQKLGFMADEATVERIENEMPAGYDIERAQAALGDSLAATTGVRAKGRSLPGDRVRASDQHAGGVSDRPLAAAGLSKVQITGEFVVNSRAWYSKAAQVPAAGLAEDIHVSIDDSEFAIVWHESIRCEGRPVPQLTIFHDAWALFGSHAGVFAELSRLAEGGACPQPDEVIGALKRLGLRDTTKKLAPVMDTAEQQQTTAPARPRMR